MMNACDDLLYCEKCGAEMSEDDPHTVIVENDLHLIICQQCRPVQPTDVGRYCDRCEVETSDANPVRVYQAATHDVYGDPQPPETTYLCVDCAQVDESEIPY